MWFGKICVGGQLNFVILTPQKFEDAKFSVLRVSKVNGVLNLVLEKFAQFVRVLNFCQKILH